MDRTIIYPITPQQDGLRVETDCGWSSFSAGWATLPRTLLLSNGCPKASW